LKSPGARSLDIDRAWTELSERVENAPGIHCLGEWGDGLRYTVRVSGATLIVVVEPELHEGELWAHLSVSVFKPKARVPTWDELRWCKDVFIGPDRKAVTVFPPRAEYVNHHEHCLHLFAALERDPLPDFRAVCAITGQVSI
jgi:hypothetical protein